MLLGNTPHLSLIRTVLCLTFFIHNIHYPMPAFQVPCNVIPSQTRAAKPTSWLKRQVSASAGKSAVAAYKRSSTSSSQVEVAETPSYNFCSKSVFCLFVPPPWGKKRKEQRINYSVLRNQRKIPGWDAGVQWLCPSGLITSAGSQQLTPRGGATRWDPRSTSRPSAPRYLGWNLLQGLVQSIQQRRHCGFILGLSVPFVQWHARQEPIWPAVKLQADRRVYLGPDVLYPGVLI